jgi:excisionase family DNA binding protein
VHHPDAGRCLTVPQVAEELATSEIQVVSMLRRGDIRAIKLGGRGQWRIERAELEAYIQRQYEETEKALRSKAKNHG